MIKLKIQRKLKYRLKSQLREKNCKNYYLRALPVCGSKILITRMSPDSETEASTMEHNSQKSNATTLARLQNSKSCTVQKGWVPESSTHQTRTKAWKLKNINNASVWIGSNYSAYRQPEFHIQIMQIWRVLKHVSTSWQLVASTKAPTLPPTMWPSSDLAVQRLIDSGYLRTFRIQSDTKEQRITLRSLPKVLSRCVILGRWTAAHMTSHCLSHD